MSLILVFVLFVLSLTNATHLGHCPNLHPTNDFDEESVLGMWYIHEYIFHKENETKTDFNPYCPIVQIRKFEDYVNGGLINRNLVSLPALRSRLINFEKVRP